MRLLHILNRIQEIGTGTSDPFPLTRPKITAKIRAEILRARPVADRIKAPVWGEVPFRYVADAGSRKYGIILTAVVTTQPSRRPKWPALPPVFITLDIRFNLIGQRGEGVTNLNEHFRVMASVIEAVRDFSKTVEPVSPVWVVKIAPKSDIGDRSDTESRRGRFYSAYINRHGLKVLPGQWGMRNSGTEFRLDRKSPIKKKG